MSSFKDYRHSISKSAYSKNPAPSVPRPRSSHAIDHQMETSHNFMEYKIENRNIDQTLKSPLVPINHSTEHRHSSAHLKPPSVTRDASSVSSFEETTAPDMDDKENILPLKVFDGTKRGITDVSQQSRSYFWLRRIKEIFLKMGTAEGPFVTFDMELARTDMLTTCDVYLKHDFSKLKNKV